MSPLFGRDKKEEKKEEPKREVYTPSEVDEEELIAEDLKRVDIENGKVEVVDIGKPTPYVSRTEEEEIDIEDQIILENSNMEGLLALVKITENVDVKQDHYVNVDSIEYNGELSIKNTSNENRLWDINLLLKNADLTNLESEEIEITELGTADDDNSYTEEFQIEDKAKNLLLVKEFINTLPDAEDILNQRDIESELEKYEDKLGTVKDEEDLEEEEEELNEEYALESFAISKGKVNTVTFAIAVKNLFEKSASNIKITKTLPSEFEHIQVSTTTQGETDVSGGEIVWNIANLEPERVIILKFTAEISIESIETKNTGEIAVEFQGNSPFAKGLDIDTFEGYSRNRFYIDTIERDEEPGVWDAKLVFENSSDFVYELTKIDVSSLDDDSQMLLEIDPESIPKIPPSAKWHSKKWNVESEEYPRFKREIEFKVVPYFQTIVSGTMAISEVELAIASITGDFSYDKVEVPTFKVEEVNANLEITNNGSAPLNEVKVIQTNFNDYYRPAESNEVEILLDGEEVDESIVSVSFEDNNLEISLLDLRDSDMGMFQPDSTLEFKYPIHIEAPSKDTTFESEITCLANTYPPAQEVEFIPEVPVIEAVHMRRKLRSGKEVIPIGELGNYQIILWIENVGNTPIEDVEVMDNVPDNFEYGEFSMEPEVTDEVGKDTLKWTIEELEAEQTIEISYEITGSGEYEASKAQVGY
ncbi:MAG: hypothetical protein BAJALOKI2v1_750004 [Promethearchaeota archaeon]|nr:MAG: hypothetical protein BAJALOKI2v1_750004 [Candidatus Lokiarchaeota archaeon]